MSVRAERVSAEIRRYLSSILARLKNPNLSGMVSIMRVETDAELKHSKIFISVYGGGTDLKKTVEILTESKGYIKKELSACLKSMRCMPDLHFLPDDSLEYGEHINRIINDLNKSGN